MRRTVDRDPLSGQPASPHDVDQPQQLTTQQLALKVRVPAATRVCALMMYKQLAVVHQGAWRSILEALRGQQGADQQEVLCNAAYITLACSKLRMQGAAVAELQKLGNLDAPSYTASADHGMLHSKMLSQPSTS